MTRVELSIDMRNITMNAPVKHTHGRYQIKEVVGTYLDKMGEERVVHRPKGRLLRVLKEMNTPALRMNRVAAELLEEKIRNLRIAKGLTLEELATKAGLRSQTNKQYMWSIENSVRKEGVRIGTLFALARVLECEVGDILPSVQDVVALANIAEETITRAT